MNIPKSTTCLNNHEAIQVCTQAQCQNFAIFCKQQQCQYVQQHAKCLNNAKIYKIIDRIGAQTKNYEVFINKIIMHYDSIIKFAISQKQEILKCQDHLFQQIEGNSKKLSNWLKNNQFSKIKSSFINKTMKQLDKENKKRYEHSEIILQQISKSLQEIKDQFAFIRYQWIDGIKISNQYKFAKQLCATNYTISNSGRSIELITQDRHKFALIHPSISFDNNFKQSILLRIIKIQKQDLWIGIGNFQKIKNSSFAINSFNLNHGVYVCRCNSGFVYNSTSKQQNSTTTNFRFEQRDLVQMRCHTNTMKLLLTNLTKKISLQIPFERLKDDELHFCIWTCYEGTEVEIVDKN